MTRLAQRRKRLRLSQQDVADVLGTTRERVSDFELGKRALPFKKGRTEYENALQIASAVLDVTLHGVPTEG